MNSCRWSFCFKVFRHRRNTPLFGHFRQAAAGGLNILCFPPVLPGLITSLLAIWKHLSESFTQPLTKIEICATYFIKVFQCCSTKWIYILFNYLQVWKSVIRNKFFLWIHLLAQLINHQIKNISFSSHL